MKKDIEFVMNGEETELDKTVVDKIGDPLVHMIRNAVDHGIEDTAQDRIEAGKPPKGKINLKAFHKGGNIYIEIADDGKGLKRETILQKAIDKGIISNGSSLTDKEVWSLIFAPGFSTAQKITEVSGRGVGMDVVKKNIEQLRGSVEIQSEYGKGSVFSMRLPLTLAIIDGMVISSCGEKYVIPTLSIVTSVRLDESDIKTVQSKGRVLSIQNELIPLFELEKILELKAPEKSVKPEQLIVIVEDEGQKTGIIIDQLLGQQQIVIKNLGKYLYGNTPGISGGAIMPDGSVGLIIDVAGLVRITSPLSESAVNSKGKANVQQN
jgi:two-component system chemotaxis sensor kinase CheA